ncbi:MAG TPA: TrkA C-terminal domain-containing protein [Egibacteraceae bacterium]|nr:potassium channel protein [Actinomycetota bacterium]HWB71412.1 TrkA C-terminal domain-containing protein [Egibacteraceae bacterium]
MRPNVKDLLVEAKDVSELMVDLAYAAVFFGDDDLAREVIRLEERMDATVHEMRILCMLAARSPDDAEQLGGILSMAGAIEEIADAAEDIARVVLKDIGVPGELRDDLRHAEEVLARVKLRAGNRMASLSLHDLALPRKTGMWVIAVRRDVDYVHGPSGDTVLQDGDVLFLQGPAEGVDLVRELAGGEPFHLGPPRQDGRLSNLDRAVDILVELKNAAEVAVGLAYSAILFRDRGLAHEVSGVEDITDDLYNDLQRWVLRAAADLDDEELAELRGLLQIGQSSERIADAAQEMTRIAESDEEPHPVIATALSEADEIVTDAVVASGSPAERRTMRELSLETDTGMYVLAIQRGGRWIYRPRGTRQLEAGDRLLATGPEEGVEPLRRIAGDVREVQPAHV